MRHLYERDANTKVAMFQPIMYRTQVVAGVHYFIKVGSQQGKAGSGPHSLPSSTSCR